LRLFVAIPRLLNFLVDKHMILLWALVSVTWTVVDPATVFLTKVALTPSSTALTGLTGLSGLFCM
jgi:hypothetical protein